MKRTLIVVTLLIPLVAQATMPATAEQRLCGGAAIVFAKVVDGGGADCRLESLDATCSLRNVVRLSVVIRKVLGVDMEPKYPDLVLRSVKGPIPDMIGETVDIYVRVSDPPDIAVHHAIHDVADGYGELTGSTSRPLVDKDVQKLYVGKTLIFSIGIKSSRDNAYWSTAWPTRSKSWVMETLRLWKDTDCPRPYDARRAIHPIK